MKKSRSYQTHTQEIISRENLLIESALQCLEARIQGSNDILKSTADVRAYLNLKLAIHLNEVFAVLFLTTKNHLLSFEILFYGSINETTICPRIVLQRGLALNAAAVIFAHNHPSGSIEPSPEDKRMTQEIKKLLKVVDINVLDHFIVSGNNSFSFADHGLM